MPSSENQDQRSQTTPDGVIAGYPALPELVTIEGEDIVIRITPDALKFASEQGALATFWPKKNDFRKVRVTDLDAWRKEVVAALRREAENGDTPVHLLLDAALEWAAEQGGEGVWIEGVD